MEGYSEHMLRSRTTGRAAEYSSPTVFFGEPDDVLPTENNTGFEDVTLEEEQKKKEKKADERANRRKRAWRSCTRYISFLFKTALIGLLSRLPFVPRSWTQKDMVTNKPVIYDVLEKKKKILLIAFLFTLAFLTFLVVARRADALWGPMEILDPEKDTMIKNPYKRRRHAAPIDIYDSDLQQWLVKHGGVEASDEALDAGVLEVPVYSLGGTKKNVSFSLLKSDLDNLASEFSVSCVCALHLGIPLNIVFLPNQRDKKLLIDPEMKQHSAEKVQMSFNGVDKVYFPKQAVIEYKKQNGWKARDSFVDKEAACILFCVKAFVTPANVQK